MEQTTAYTHSLTHFIKSEQVRQSHSESTIRHGQVAWFSIQLCNSSSMTQTMLYLASKKKKKRLGKGLSKTQRFSVQIRHIKCAYSYTVQYMNNVKLFISVCVEIMLMWVKYNILEKLILFILFILTVVQKTLHLCLMLHFYWTALL